MISVVIPVGPFPSNKRWLDECLHSCFYQTIIPDEVLLIDDGANIGDRYHNGSWHYRVVVWKCPWRTGVSHAFNYGVALAQSECVIMLGSDDTLEPTAIEQALQSYEKHSHRDAYYYFGLKYMDTGELQTAPCNAAMVTKGFWRLSGGFPIEFPSASDTMLLSICLAHRLPVYPIANGAPLYNYRRHPDTDTARYGGYHEIKMQIRDMVTRHWQPPEWGNNYDRSSK